jgi:hypothetical protein
MGLPTNTPQIDIPYCAGISIAPDSDVDCVIIDSPSCTEGAYNISSNSLTVPTNLTVTRNSPGTGRLVSTGSPLFGKFYGPFTVRPFYTMKSTNSAYYYTASIIVWIDCPPNYMFPMRRAPKVDWGTGVATGSVTGPETLARLPIYGRKFFGYKFQNANHNWLYFIKVSVFDSNAGQWSVAQWHNVSSTSTAEPNIRQDWTVFANNLSAGIDWHYAEIVSTGAGTATSGDNIRWYLSARDAD